MRDSKGPEALRLPIEVSRGFCCFMALMLQVCVWLWGSVCLAAGLKKRKNL